MTWKKYPEKVLLVLNASNLLRHAVLFRTLGGGYQATFGVLYADERYQLAPYQ